MYKMASASPRSTPVEVDVPIRCFMNGCFDLMHFGHLNALRQIKQYNVKNLIFGKHGETSTFEVLVTGVKKSDSG